MQHFCLSRLQCQYIFLKLLSLSKKHQCQYQVSTSYTIQFPRYSLDNFRSKIKSRCTCIRPLQKQSPQYKLSLYNLKDYDKCFNMHSMWHKMLANKITNKFWKSILLLWVKVIDNITENKRIKHMLNRPPWCHLLISNVPIFYQDWYTVKA